VSVPRAAQRGVRLKSGQAMKKLIFKSAVQGEGRAILPIPRNEPGRYGHIVLIAEPGMEKGLLFVWDVPEGGVPEKYRNAVFAGIEDLFSPNGELAKYECASVQVRIIGGSWHEWDSSEKSFSAAAQLAFMDAARRGGLL